MLHYLMLDYCDYPETLETAVKVIGKVSLPPSLFRDLLTALLDIDRTCSRSGELMTPCGCSTSRCNSHFRHDMIATIVIGRLSILLSERAASPTRDD